MKPWKRFLFLTAALLLLAVCLSACSQRREESSSSPVSSEAVDLSLFPEGTSIGGKNISGKTVEEALKICRDAIGEAMETLEITVKFKDDTVALKKEDFVTRDVLELTVPQLLELRQPGEYPLSYVTDLSESGLSKLREAAKACTVKGQDATVEGYNGEAFTFTEEKKGVRVDMGTTLKSVRQLLSQKHGGAIQAVLLETAPTVTKKALSEKFKLMSSYTTDSTNTENGNSNMALALSHVNGTVIQPGQTFSYNGTIGDSTDPDAGWKTAGGLMGGLSVQVYGGGICQGSTTLYNAALLAGMEIVERDCHSTPSSYCPIGLDATVDYGNIDFQFRNPLKTPVYIASWMDDVTLHVNFYGCFPDEWDKITVGSEQTGYEDPLSEVSFKEDSNLEKGQYVRVSSGNSGYSARAWRIYYKGDTEVKREDLPTSYYEPTGITYSVGPGTDTGKVDTSKESGSTEAAPKPTATPTPEPTPEATPTPAPEPPAETPAPEQPEETPTPEQPEETPAPESPESSELIDWS